MQIKMNQKSSKQHDLNALQNNPKYYLEDHRPWFLPDFMKANLLTTKHYREVTENLETRFLREKKNEEVVLKLRHIDVTYGRGSRRFKAVRDLSLNIYKGEILGLVGESGSGKSTTGNVIAGLVPRSFGSMQIRSKEIPRDLSKIDAKLKSFMVNNVQMIFQDPAGSLNPNKNVYKIVAEGLNNLSNLKELLLRKFNAEFINRHEKLIKQIKSKKFNIDNLHKLNEKMPEKAETFLYNKFLWFINNKMTSSSLSSKLNKEVTKDLEAFKKIGSTNAKNEKKNLVINLLKSVGLDDSILGRYPLEFSGGQQQRIGISRAIVVRPTLLVADEPISALDVSIQAQVINIFKDLRELYDLTILLIAHDLKMVEYISDRIAVMYKGNLVEIGTSEDIMQNSLHPYTKSLLNAVPSIESEKGSLVGYVYDPQIHEYTEEKQPKWVQLSEQHFILATDVEVAKWKNNEY